jgi:hypothetical protein
MRHFLAALWRIIALSIAHQVVWFLAAIVTYGTDLDQLRSRSAISRAVGVVNDILSFPHDAIIRAVPRPWLITHPGLVVPTALIVSSLLWGIALYAAWRGVRKLRERRRLRENG